MSAKRQRSSIDIIIVWTTTIASRMHDCVARLFTCTSEHLVFWLGFVVSGWVQRCTSKVCFKKIRARRVCLCLVNKLVYKSCTEMCKRVDLLCACAQNGANAAGQTDAHAKRAMNTSAVSMCNCIALQRYYTSARLYSHLAVSIRPLET